MDIENINDSGPRLFSKLPYLGCLIVLLILPFVINSYYLSMLTKVLIFGIFAMSLDLILGYTGLPSLGHALFLGVAGYTTGILMVHFHIDNFWILAPVSILASGAAALIFGFLALRVSGIYFLLITLAFGELLKIVSIHWRTMTGGSNGLMGISYPYVGISGFSWPSPSFYFLVFICFIISFILLRRITGSAFGRALVGIRENEQRMQSLGFNTWAHKYLAYIIAGLFAGLSGMLFAFFYGIMVPGNLGLNTSATVMLMVVIGSPGTLVGPVIGSMVIVLLEHITSIYTPERWPLLLGVVFVISVMFIRGGLGIHLSSLWGKVTKAYGNLEDQGTI